MTSHHPMAQEFHDAYEQTIQMPPLPEQLADDYRIISCLKETPEKSVYLLSGKNGEQCILKTGAGRYAEALRQEHHIHLRLSASKKIPMPKALACYEANDVCYLLTSYIDGRNLVQYQEKCAPLSETEVISLTYKMCRIVRLLHAENPPVIHRDLKPENFVLEKDTGILYLVDFDTSRLFLPGKDRDTEFVGTMSQAAPEQFGYSQSDIRTDIFGLGKTMLYLLTGDTETENISRQGISSGLRKIVIKSTAFDPRQRYKDTTQFIRDLRRYQTRRTNTFSYPMAAVCAVFFLCIGFAGGFLLKNGSQGSPSASNPPLADAAQAGENHKGNGNAQSNADSNVGDPKSNTDDIGDGTMTSADDIELDNTAQTENTDDSTIAPDSLMAQAGVSEFDFLNYKDSLDALILDFYKNDGDAVAADLEAMLTMMKNDKALNSVAVADYAEMDSETTDWDTFWTMDPLTRLRTNLAYKEQLVYRSLGQYNAAQNYIMASLGHDLNSIGEENSLLNYAKGNYPYGFENELANTLADTIAIITDGLEKYTDSLSDQ